MASGTRRMNECVCKEVDDSSSEDGCGRSRSKRRPRGKKGESSNCVSENASVCGSGRDEDVVAYAKGVNGKSRVGEFMLDDFDGVKVESKKERKARMKRERQMAEREREAEERRVAEELRKNESATGRKRVSVCKSDCASVVGTDRVKAGINEVYVVCEDISQGVKRIKRETPDESLNVRCENADAMDVVNEERDGAVPLDPLEESRGITSGLRHLVLNESNKVTKWMSQRILSQASKFEILVQRLLLENARLQGRLEEREKMDELAERMSASAARVEKAVKNVRENLPEVSSIVQKVSESVSSMNVPSPIAGSVRPVVAPKSYAVIVKGANEDLSAAEVKRRMNEAVYSNVDVRVRAVKGVKGGGVVIETPSEQDRRLITGCPGFAEAGLRVQEPKKLDPRVLVYDVPCVMTDETMLQGMYEKSVKESMSADDFVKSVKVVKRLKGVNEKVCNVIVECPYHVRNMLLRDGRVYVRWSSYKVVPWERVPRCFRCLGYNHRANECKSERLCWRCSKPGHGASACRSAEDCGNCRAKGLPAGHAATSPRCPEYEWRLKLLRSRISYG